MRFKSDISRTLFDFFLAFTITIESSFIFKYKFFQLTHIKTVEFIEINIF